MNEAQVRWHWDRVAPAWINHIRQEPGDEGDTARRYMLNPVLFDLLGDVAGRRVADIGCGEGYLTRALARRGAAAVGIDVSGEMLAEVRRQEERAATGAQYVQSPIERVPPELGGQFDLAVSNMVFNILQDHEAAFASSLRLLAPSGRFVVSVVHPAFDDVRQGWVETTDGDVRWSANRYFERVRGRAAGGAPSFHRCLSDYITAGLATGAVLTGFCEPVYTGALERSLPPDRRAWARVPYVAVMRFQKTG